MAKYNTYIELSPHYESVVDIDSESRHPDMWQEYIVHEDMKGAIEKICDSMKYEDEDKRRSFWIHGAYGTGKSYAAIVLKHLFEDKVDSIRKFLSNQMLIPYREKFLSIREKGEFLASDNLYRKYGRPLTEFVGKSFRLFGDTIQTYRLGAALENVRYNDFEQARDSYTFLYKLDWYDTGLELCVRVRENKDHDFIQRLKTDSEKQFRIGNIFISEIRSFKDIRRNFQQTWSNDLRNYVMGMGFLLLNIFLGLLGTFWFRTQQRRSEIALHKVHGASDMSIFTRLISEGLLLLLLVTPVALLIDYNLASMELNSWRNGTTLEWERLLLCAAISFLLIGLMIAIGIGIPARRAMKVQPAEALHDE